MSQNFLGCDLCKARIDIFDPRTGALSEIANEPVAISAWLGQLDPDIRIVFEATSGCDGRLIAALAHAGRAYSRVNPRQAREFARASGVLAKTDRVDARVLAEMGARLDLPVTRPPEPKRMRLAAKLKRRQQLVVMRQAERLRLDDTDDRDIQREIKAMIRLLCTRIERLDAVIAEFLETDDTLSPQARRVMTVPGIGSVAGATLLAHLPELGQIDRRAIASLAGLAPLARDSGTMRGKRRIWGGRKQIRRALYIAALNAARCVPRYKAIRDRMRAAGKAAKTILIAIARHILVALNAMFRNGTDFEIQRTG